MRLYKNSAKVAKERLKAMKDNEAAVRMTEKDRKDLVNNTYHKED